MRIHNMATVREVLYQSTKGFSNREIAKSFEISRNTVVKYLQLAKQNGFNKNTSGAILDEIAIKVHEVVHKTVNKPNGFAMVAIAKHQDKIEAWLTERNITHTQIQRLLFAEGISVSTRSVDRFVSTYFPDTMNTPWVKTHGIIVDLKVECNLRLPHVFLPLLLNVISNHFFIYSYCRYKISI